MLGAGSLHSPPTVSQVHSPVPPLRPCPLFLTHIKAKPHANARLLHISLIPLFLPPCRYLLQDEEVEKSCEKCGTASVGHMVRHSVRRLPAVLVVHLKRFKHEAVPGGQYKYSKLHTLVNLEAGQLRLAAHCQPGIKLRPCGTPGAAGEPARAGMHGQCVF